VSSVPSFSSFLFVVEDIVVRKCVLGAPNFQKRVEAARLHVQHTIKFLSVFGTCVLGSLRTTNPRPHEPCCPNSVTFSLLLVK